jgi:fused signal recognition particle receptor
MRFWRRNVTSEPAPQPEEQDADEAARLPQPETGADVAEVEAPSPLGEAAASPSVVQPAERPTWWRRPVQAEPVAQPEEKSADKAEGLREAEPEPKAPQAAVPPPDPVSAELSTSNAEWRPWFWQWDVPPEPSPETPEPAAGHEEDISRLHGPEPEASSPAAAPPAAPREESVERRGWFARLKAGLSRSSARLNDGINTIFNRRRLDDEALEELEELLISSDMGVGIAAEVTESLRRTRFNQEVSPEEVRAALAEQVVRLIEPVTRPLRIERSRRPFVILVIGVNGSGKTTTIAKLAKQYRDQGMRVVLAAGDTFRAAAVEQLQIWGERTGSTVVTRPQGADAAGLAYDALVEAQREGADVLMIDTAGRLHNKADLMGELQKIVRVLKKLDADTPHSVLLVLDATTGQNAHAQAEIFREMVGVTGIVMTKLDGTARGGVLVSLAEKYGIPIHAIGVGETADDLRPFEATAYARSLVGLEP